jgi:hypothetical protein
MTPDRFSKITETDQFRFGFLFRFFGQNRKNRWHKTADSQPVSELILYTAHEHSTHRWQEIDNTQPVGADLTLITYTAASTLSSLDSSKRGTETELKKNELNTYIGGLLCSCGRGWGAWRLDDGGFATECPSQVRTPPLVSFDGAAPAPLCTAAAAQPPESNAGLVVPPPLAAYALAYVGKG